MKRFKLYRSLNAITFGTMIMVKGAPKYITFTGGSTHTGIIKGAYGTSDPDEQEAIENDSLYNVEFTIDERMSEPETKPDQDRGEDDDCTVVDNINNAQEAKEYLLKTYEDLTPDDVANVEKVKAVMADKQIRFNPYRPR